MRKAYHHRGSNGGMLVQRLLNLARVHVVSPADDEVFFAVDDVVEAILVDATDVTGAEPAILDRRLGRIGQVPVALHHIVSADLDFTGGRHWHLVAVVIDDPHLNAIDGRADGSDLANPVGTVEAHRRRRFRQAVTFQHRAAETVLEGAQYLYGHRRAAGDADPQRADVDAIALGRRQHPNIHRRNALEYGDSFGCNHSQRFSGVEPGQ